MLGGLLDFPKYCDYPKNLLVEELVFTSSPVRLHYGKCAVIGQLYREDNKYYLQNIRLSYLDEQHQMETGAIKILLLDMGNGSFQKFVDNKFAEVFGEAVFWPITESVDNQNTTAPTTTKDLVQQLRLLNIDSSQIENMDPDESQITSTFDEEAVEQAIEKFNSNYVPAIRISVMNLIDQAEKMIAYNLELRKVFEEQRKVFELD